MRFPLRTAQIGTVRENSKKMESWTPTVYISSAVHCCRSRAHEESSHSWSLTHHSKILWKTRIQGQQLEAAAESPGNIPVSLA